MTREFDRNFPAMSETISDLSVEHIPAPPITPEIDEKARRTVASKSYTATEAAGIFAMLGLDKKEEPEDDDD